MSYEEFTSVNERVIVRNKVMFRYLRISEFEYLIEVTIKTFSEIEYVKMSNVVTGASAYRAYENVLNSGLE